MPLAGFGQALAGAPADSKKYAEAFKQSMIEVRERERALVEQYRKKLEEQKAAAAKDPAKDAKQAPAKK